MVVAAVGGTAASGSAESVVARSGELVAREAPGSGQAGIAVLRGSDRVQLLGERDGWSEILLPDGRRAWVPTTDITHIAEAPRPSASSLVTPSPLATAGVGVQDPSTAALASEVTRLRSIVDELSAAHTRHDPQDPGTMLLEADGPWLVGGIALVVGILVGGAWERHRGRRDRSLRF